MKGYIESTEFGNEFGSAINLIHTSVLRFSAIQCAAAVPRSPAESSSSRKFEQSNLQAASETQVNELTTNGHGPPASKQVSQQPKGIMGMLLSKAATKTQDTNKETKAEAKEVTHVSLLTLGLEKRDGVQESLRNFCASLFIERPRSVPSDILQFRHL